MVSCLILFPNRATYLYPLQFSTQLANLPTGSLRVLQSLNNLCDRPLESLSWPLGKFLTTTSLQCSSLLW